jgi:hypothetical protein
MKKLWLTEAFRKSAVAVNSAIVPVHVCAARTASTTSFSGMTVCCKRKSPLWVLQDRALVYMGLEDGGDDKPRSALETYDRLPVSRIEPDDGHDIADRVPPKAIVGCEGNLVRLSCNDFPLSRR